MIKGKFLTAGDPETQKCFAVREKVFVEEQNCPPEEEFDAVDRYAMFAAVYNEADEVVGTGRVYMDDEGNYHAGRIAVLKEARGNSYGEFIVRMLCDRAFANGAKQVHIGAQVQAIGFYEKIGFRVCGESYDDVAIPHKPMVLQREDFTSKCGGCITYGK